MAGWKCSRCGTSNEDIGITCSRCGSSRGSVAIPGAPAGAPPAAPAAPAAPAGPAPLSASPTDVEALPVATASEPFWRRIPLGWILFAGILAVGAMSSWFFAAGRSDSGEITRSGDLDVNELRVGDCFDLKDPDAEELTQVTARPCSEEHEYETFFIGTMAAGPYPSEATFEQYIVAQCEPAFGRYVGMDYQRSRLEVTWVGPTTGGWNDGDRSVQCHVFDPQTSRLTESLKGSRR
jgi:hypothetical protein